MWDDKSVSDMQCRVFCMAAQHWQVQPETCADIFEKYNVFEFIETCYDSLHLNSYQCALDDVEQMILANGGAI